MSRINAPVGVTTDQQPLLSGADDLIVVGNTAARAYSEVLVQLKNRNIPRQFNQRLR